VFQNSPFTITYQAALSEFITTPLIDGGLGGVVDSTINPQYAAQDIFDRAGRIIDMQLASTGRDTITGTTGADFIQGGPGADTINGGTGADVFIYTDVRDAIDTINAFELNTDKIDVSALLTSIGVASNANALGVNLTFVNITNGVRINYVIPGRPARPLVSVLGTGVDATTINAAANFVF
jgi:5'-nucleotidase